MRSGGRRLRLTAFGRASARAALTTDPEPARVRESRPASAPGPSAACVRPHTRKPGAKAKMLTTRQGEGLNKLDNARGCGYTCHVVAGRPALLLLGVALLPIFVALTPLAYASPPDPTWVSGVFDDDDHDNVVVLIMSSAAALDPFLGCSSIRFAVFAAAIAWEEEGPVSSQYVSSAGARAPPLS
jgi:hypothetical protein